MIVNSHNIQSININYNTNTFTNHLLNIHAHITFRVKLYQIVSVK